jgi:hypothetical protein
MSMSIPKLLFIAADLMDEVKPANPEKTIIPGIGDVFLIVAVCAAIGVGVLIWAVFLRGASRRNRESLRTAPASSSSRRRKRKQRYTNRNPTLAETGGLPPIREEGPGKNPPL